jgi:hypothetical protein
MLEQGYKIEQNMPLMRTLPYINTDMGFQKKSCCFRNEKAFRKRCLFNYDKQNMHIHMASIDSLTNSHLRDSTLQLPHEDEVFRKIGQKKSVHIIDKRNGILTFLLSMNQIDCHIS